PIQPFDDFLRRVLWRAHAMRRRVSATDIPNSGNEIDLTRSSSAKPKNVNGIFRRSTTLCPEASRLSGHYPRFARLPTQLRHDGLAECPLGTAPPSGEWGVRQMHCFVCDANMVLVSVAPDRTMGSGFEHHFFLCSQCRDTERRLVF